MKKLTTSWYLKEIGHVFTWHEEVARCGRCGCRSGSRSQRERIERINRTVRVCLDRQACLFAEALQFETKPITRRQYGWTFMNLGSFKP